MNRFTFTTWTDWDFLWKRLNWVDFTFIHIEFENDKMFGNLELTLGLLGFNCMLSWHYKDTEFMAELEDKITQLKL